MLCNTLLNNRIQYSLRYQLLDFSNIDIDVNNIRKRPRLLVQSPCSKHLLYFHTLRI